MKDVKAIIEIAMYSKYKYEIKDGVLVLDRPLNQMIPANYGYFPNTLAEDNDPLDCFVLSSSPLVNSAQCKVEIIGGYKCTDQEVPDHKLIVTLNGDLCKSQLNEIQSISHYLETYKKGFKVLEWVGKEEAEEILAKSSKVFLRNVDKLKEELTKPRIILTKFFDDCE
jgi:inorganic pyrophosphatase